MDKAALASGAPERENTNKRGILDILVDTLNENAGDGERWERQYNTPQMECGDERWRNLDGRFACTAQSERESVELLYGEPPTPESDGIMNIEIPLSSFSPSAIPKLIKLVDAKSTLLKMSLGTDNLPILKTIDTLVFPWFRNDGDPGMAQTYSELICLICKAANEKKRVTARARPPINPCYEMRCFLLSLGCIGPEYKTMRKNLLSGLAGGIGDALPALIPSIIEAVILIVTKLLNNMDKILEAAFKIIEGLAKGLIDALPKLVEMLPKIIMSIIDFITSNLPKIIEMGIKLIVELAAGLIKAIPQLVAALPQIVMAIITGVGKAAVSILEVGKNIVKGLWDGIASMITWITGKIKDFVGGIVSGVKGLLGIKSPSTVFAGIGENMGEGIGVGFDRAMNKVADDMQNAIEVDTENGVSGTASFKAIGVPGMTKYMEQTVYPASRRSFTISAQIGSENLEKGPEGQVGIVVIFEYEDGTVETRQIDLL